MLGPGLCRVDLRVKREDWGAGAEKGNRVPYTEHRADEFLRHTSNDRL
ncbi:MAG: hypothetical protein HC794_00095 [Nitrospiraceae bacterium]|nr:hypothetical protein [Nitrospiraceae bacterium]